MSLDYLAKKIAQQDQSAFAELYEKTRKIVYSVCLSIVKDSGIAEDLTQETFVCVWSDIGNFRGKGLKTWVLTIARNKALNVLRKRKRETVVDESTLVSVGGKTETPTGEVFEALNKALDETEKQIVILHVLWGYKHREIAVELQMPLGTVLSKYNVSVKKLREYLIKGDNANV